jgi:hypothetical protein
MKKSPPPNVIPIGRAKQTKTRQWAPPKPPRSKLCRMEISYSGKSVTDTTAARVLQQLGMMPVKIVEMKYTSRGFRLLLDAPEGMAVESATIRIRRISVRSPER